MGTGVVPVIIANPNNLRVTFKREVNIGICQSVLRVSLIEENFGKKRNENQYEITEELFVLKNS